MSIPDRSETKYIVIHCTATGPDYKGGVAGIREYHLSLGWSDIGYNYVIDTDGSIIEARGRDKVGAHVRGFNQISCGIALIGGLTAKGNPSRSFTPEQWTSLERLCIELTQLWPDAVICGHRSLSPDANEDGLIATEEFLKTCPNFNAMIWAKEKGLPAANINEEWHELDPRRPAPPDDRIAYLQRCLMRLGYSIGPNDGVMGPSTRGAILQFQKDNNLRQTRDFDAVTVEKLRSLSEHVADAPPKPRIIEPPAPPTSGMTDGTVGALASFFAFLAGIPAWLTVVALLLLGAMIYWGARERKRWRESQEAMLRGDPLPAPKPDMFDRIYAVAAELWAPSTRPARDLNPEATS